jgi:hypothetical protein
MRQNSYNHSVSLKAQESICDKFAHENKMNIKSVYKEVHSAFNKVPSVLRTVINLRNCVIVISDISRFSRSIVIGLDMAKTAVKNKNVIVFIQEKFVCRNHIDFITLEQHLQKTEAESVTIGLRIKKAKNYLVENGIHTGGSAPYGYDVIDRIAVKNTREQAILKFIRTCKQTTISSDVLNKMMIHMSKTKPYDPISCYNTKGVSVKLITEQLTNTEIAQLLNSYDVDKRGRRWSTYMIKTALLSNDRQNNTINSKKTDPNLLTDWSSMKMVVGQITTQSTNTNQKITNPNNMDASLSASLSTPMTQVKRQSTRLNPNMTFEILTNPTQQNIDTNDMDDIMQDTKLFNQFRRFRKMMLE